MVRLSVSSSSTLTVTFQEPQCLNSTVVTKYRGTQRRPMESLDSVHQSCENVSFNADAVKL